MRTPHTRTAKGKVVRIVTRAGLTVEGRFHSRTSRGVKLEGHRHVPKDQIQKFIIVKRGKQ